MTDREWMRGWAKLLGARLPGSPDSPGLIAEVAASRREDLDDLSGEAWLYAVLEAKKLEHWFPPSARLREYAAGYRAPVNERGLPPSALTADELEQGREARRQAARRGLAMIEEACRAAGVPLRSEVVQSIPRVKRGEEQGE